VTKGIILAGGYGTRMYPNTLGLSKQLLPVYDKPMIFYPLATLMSAGIREILLICLPNEVELFERILGDGSQWGISIEFARQAKPRGIAEAFLIGETFIGNEPVCLILGDNIIYGDAFPKIFAQAITDNKGATIFAYIVSDPSQYGVIRFDENNKPVELQEKPSKPISKHAVIGLYVYDNKVVEIAKELKPSARGELEITDINRAYLANNQLTARRLGRGMAWLDTGTHQSMLDAANFIHVIEMRQGLKVYCPEEIAWRCGYISDDQLIACAKPWQNSSYGQYLLNLFDRSPLNETIPA